MKVEPVWNKLAARADTLGYVQAGEPAPRLSDEPNLRLLLDNGRELAACWHDAQRHMFFIPRGTRPVRLLSHAAVPAQVMGPFVDDRRQLGVAVDRMPLWTGLQEQPIAVEAIDRDGWHAPEGQVRWTNGAAAPDLPEASSQTLLKVHVAGTLPYWAPGTAA